MLTVELHSRQTTKINSSHVTAKPKGIVLCSILILLNIDSGFNAGRRRIIRHRTPTTSDVEAAAAEDSSDDDSTLHQKGQINQDNTDENQKGPFRKGSIRNLPDKVVDIVHKARQGLSVQMWTSGMFPTVKELDSAVQSLVDDIAQDYQGIYSCFSASF